MREMALVLFLLAGCGSSTEGIPLVGEVSGQFEDEPYALTYGAAFDIDPEGDYTALGKLMVWMAEPKIGCDGRFLESRAASGIYASIFLTDLEPGLHDPHSVELTRVNSSGMEMRGRQGTVDITTLDAGTVAGTVTMEDTGDEGVISISGEFEVIRCDLQI